MKLDVQNGLSCTGRMRARNYHERSGMPSMKNADNCNFARLTEENRVLRQALKNASRVIAEDMFVSSKKLNNI